MMEEIITMVSTVGFPIAAYLLLQFKLGKQIDRNTEALIKLTEIIKK